MYLAISFAVDMMLPAAKELRSQAPPPVFLSPGTADHHKMWSSSSRAGGGIRS